VLGALLVLVAVLVVAVVHAPAYVQRAWASLVAEAGEVAAAAAAGRVLDLVAACVGTVVLVLPILAMTITYVLLSRRAGQALALAHPPTCAVGSGGARERPRPGRRPVSTGDRHRCRPGGEQDRCQETDPAR
jgi:hypothetical protein